MKNVVIVAVLFLSGMIGIASSIISGAVIIATSSGIKPDLIDLIFYSFGNFNLAMPLSFGKIELEARSYEHKNTHLEVGTKRMRS
jgi:hypothetical protein